MGMTDPIADMLTRIRNASRARHQKVTVPWSRVKENIVKILIDEGYVKEARKVKAAQGGGDDLVMTRVSSPGRRVYVGANEVPPIRKGLGIHILSTPKGFLVDREAQRAKVGGELICSVW